jgi:hypothetical protein
MMRSRHRTAASRREDSPWAVPEAVRSSLVERIEQGLGHLKRRRVGFRGSVRYADFFDGKGVGDLPAVMRPTSQEQKGTRQRVSEGSVLSGCDLAVVRYRVWRYRKKGAVGRLWSRWFSSEPIRSYLVIDEMVRLEELLGKVRTVPLAGMVEYWQSGLPRKVGSWDRLTKGWRTMLDREYSGAVEDASQQARQDIGGAHASFRKAMGSLLVEAYRQREMLVDETRRAGMLQGLQVKMSQAKERLVGRLQEIVGNYQHFRWDKAGVMNAVVNQTGQAVIREEKFLGIFSHGLAHPHTKKVEAQLLEKVDAHYAQMGKVIEGILRDTGKGNAGKLSLLERTDLSGEGFFQQYYSSVPAGDLDLGMATRLSALLAVLDERSQAIQAKYRLGEVKEGLREKIAIEQADRRLVPYHPLVETEVGRMLDKSAHAPFLLPQYMARLTEQFRGTEGGKSRPWHDHYPLFTGLLVLGRRWLECVRWTLGESFFEEERRKLESAVREVHREMLVHYHPDKHGNNPSKINQVNHAMSCFESDISNMRRGEECPRWILCRDSELATHARDFRKEEAWRRKREEEKQKELARKREEELQREREEKQKREQEREEKWRESMAKLQQEREERDREFEAKMQRYREENDRLYEKILALILSQQGYDRRSEAGNTSIASSSQVFFKQAGEQPVSNLAEQESKIEISL